MKRRTPSGHLVDILAVLLLITLFAAASLTVVLLGAGVYKKTVSDMNDNFTTRTALAYLTQMIRSNDRNGNTEVLRDQNTDGLKLTASYDGDSYNIYIYVKDQSLMELTQKSSLAFNPENGRKIMDIRDLSVSEDKDDLIHIRVTGSDGETEEVSVSERSTS